MTSKYEFVVKEVMPVLRSMIARELSENYSMNQTDIAEKINITQPAVSQYVKKTRGSRKIYNEKISVLIKDLCEKIHKNQVLKENIEEEIFKISINVEKGDFVQEA